MTHLPAILRRLSTLSTVATVAVVMAGALGAGAAHADTWQISGSADSGPLAGSGYSGSASWAAPVAGYDGSVVLDAFSLDLDGRSYALSGTATGEAWYAAGVFLGIDYQSDAALTAAGAPAVQLVAGFTDLADAHLAYTVIDATDGSTALGFGSVSYTPVAAAVPEPATFALWLAGLGLVAGGLRRRAQG
ncbi:MAG: hypothetical protein RLY78_217 [Pseudomonadota bacterium]|uniref:PEP-CTERM sorting domain-containing protein n=1 Tax=Pseudaquabacterium rugosum TaxID=2984194 RepID=A0ABU9BIZ4_9BURK